MFVVFPRLEKLRTSAEIEREGGRGAGELGGWGG